MDATMATGAAAMMAIRVLLDHDVPEENIYLLSLIMAVSGVFISISVCKMQSSYWLLDMLRRPYKLSYYYYYYLIHPCFFCLNI